MIEVIYAGNDRMFDGILISVLSAARNTREPLSVTLLTMDLTGTDPAFAPINEKQRAFIERTAREYRPESRVRIIDCAEHWHGRLSSSPNAGTSYSPYTFLRLFCDRLPLPQKVLYLDADTVVPGDLSELWRTDLDGCEFAAVRDYYGKIFLGPGYFNAGVMLFDLDRIRETGLFEKAISLLCRKRLFLPDQTALYRCHEKKKLLPRRFNEQKDYEREDTVIQHFTKTILWFPYFHTRTVKPWEPEKVGQILTRRYDGLFDEYRKLKGIYENEQ